jgi:tetratricopeptide (TPR) repeat protein
MKLHLFSIFILCIFPATAGAVNRDPTDSLRNALSERLNDTANIHRYYQLASIADLHNRSQIDSAMSFLNRALAISEATGNTKHLYDIYNQYNTVYSVSGNFPIELDYLFRRLNLLDNQASEKSDTLYLLTEYARLYAHIGICYFDMDNCPKALSWYLKSLDIVKNWRFSIKTIPSTVNWYPCMATSVQPI